jgi:muconate cycloisomerase
MADESVFSPADMLGLVRIAGSDMVSIKLMKHRGFCKAREVAGIAAAAGLSAYAGSMIETGIASTAGAHLVAATAIISLGCEFYQPTYYLADDLLTDPFPVRDGKVRVPLGPGLGVTVDVDKVTKYRVK